MRAVEDALGIEIPTNARILRNLIEAIQYVQDHVIHFYHLHALDWVDIVSALAADPAATSQLAQSISDWPLSSPAYFKGVRDRLQAFLRSQRLYQEGDDGDRNYLSEEEVMAAREKVEGQIEEYCGS